MIRPNRNIETNKGIIITKTMSPIEVTLLSSFQLIIKNILKVIQKSCPLDSDLNKYIKENGKKKLIKFLQ